MDNCYSTFAGRYVSDNKPDKEKTAIRLKTFFCCFELDIVGSILYAIFDDDNSKYIDFRTFRRMDVLYSWFHNIGFVCIGIVNHEPQLQESSDNSGSFVSGSRIF